MNFEPEGSDSSRGPRRENPPHESELDPSSPSHQLMFPMDAFLSGQSHDPILDSPFSDSAVAPATDDKKKTATPPLYFAVASSCVIAVVLVLLLRVFVAQAYEIRGRSMEPTLHDGEKVMILKLAPTVDALETGDLVIFQSPRDPNKDLIKRVVALAGDTFEIRDGTVYVNDKAVEEDYANHELYPRAAYAIESPVPKNCIVVLGDNRPNSQDSRNFGAVSLDLVRGKVFLRWWPLSEMTTDF